MLASLLDDRLAALKQCAAGGPGVSGDGRDGRDGGRRRRAVREARVRNRRVRRVLLAQQPRYSRLCITGVC